MTLLVPNDGTWHDVLGLGSLVLMPQTELSEQLVAWLILATDRHSAACKGHHN
jgi:hypothetical protein